MTRYVLISIMMLTSAGAFAQTDKKPKPQQESADTNIVSFNSIVFQTKGNGLFRNIPGSASSVNFSEIRSLAPLSANEVFRKVAGVHVVDEEGAGMRINIGIRGMDPDRSRGVLVLEDGIPVSLNPYGEPEMYYSPVIDRMSGVEVLKGSGQVMFGPQTIGGVINYITANPGLTEKIRFKASGGNGGLMNALLQYSNTFNNVGIVSTLLHKRADQLGYARFGITDFSTKFLINAGKHSKLIVKLGIYNELSNSTYIGLTQTMYDRGDQDFTLMAPDDRLDIRRYSLSASHLLNISSRLKLSTTAYGYTTTRNWQRQDFSSSKTTSNQTGVVWGDTGISNGAVFMRNQNAHRDRRFEVFGAESKVNYDYHIGKVASELQAGVRYLYERAYEQRINGKKADARSGDLVEDEIRTGNAFSAYAHNRFNLSKKLLLTAGLRMESYNYERNILRNTFTLNNVARVRDTNLIANNQILTLIPGAGINYQIDDKMTLFAGLHRGYAPPRVKDAISNSGEVYQLNAEESWNYELGFRGLYKKLLTYELTAFYMDFSNQIIPVSESSGGTGSGLLNGGSTVHKGIEAAYRLNISSLFKTSSKIVLSNNLTFVQAYYTGERFKKSGTETININGNTTPYAPAYFHNASLNVELPFGLGILLSANFTGKQYTDELNTVAATADGRNGLLSAYKVFDANLYYRIPKAATTLSFTVKNLSDERYIVSKRPQGIRVGLPRYFMASVQVDL